MKRFLTALFALVSALCLCLGLAACGGDDETADENEGKHVHTYTVDNKCSGCGEVWNCTDGLEYELRGGAYVVTGIGSASGDIVIPCGYQGKFVRKIDYDAFRGCETITSVVLSDSLTEVGSGAFAECSNLTSIEISRNVNIMNYFISGCESLQRIVSHSKSSFSYNTFGVMTENSVREIEFADGVEYVDLSVMSSCPNLESVKITSEDVKHVSSLGSGSAYYKDESNWEDGCLYVDGFLVAVKDDDRSVITVKDGTRGLADSVFYLNPLTYDEFGLLVPGPVKYRSVTEIRLPEGLEIIGTRAFDSCPSVTKINIPESVRVIGPYAFFDTALYNEDSFSENGVLYLDNVLIRVKESFEGDLVIKKGTRMAADGAIGYVPDLTGRWNMGGDVGGYLSQGVSPGKVGKVTIPASMTIIGDGAFRMVESEISVESGNPVYYSEGGALYGKTGKHLIAFPYKKETGTIADGTKSIDDAAFYRCEVKSVSIPDSVTEIGDYAFYYCRQLTSVTIKGAASIGDSAFSQCQNLATIKMDRVTSVGDYAFLWCQNLRTVDMSGVTSIGTYIFSGIGYVGTSGCIQSVTIGTNLSEVSIAALDECYLQEINFLGTVAQWQGCTQNIYWVDTIHDTPVVTCTDGTVAPDGTVTYF